MRKVWGVEVLDCPCGGKRKLVGGGLRQGEDPPDAWSGWGCGGSRPEVAKARPGPQAPMFDRHCSGDGVDPPAPDYAA
jgi:hypothetical protein